MCICLFAALFGVLFARLIAVLFGVLFAFYLCIICSLFAVLFIVLFEIYLKCHLLLQLFVLSEKTDGLWFVFVKFVCDVRAMFYDNHSNHLQCSTSIEFQRIDP